MARKLIQMTVLVHICQIKLGKVRLVLFTLNIFLTYYGTLSHMPNFCSSLSKSIINGLFPSQALSSLPFPDANFNNNLDQLF